MSSSSFHDPLGVRASAEFVMSQARSVAIDQNALQQVCANFNARLRVPEWNQQYHFGDGGGRTVNYILLLDALNFSFWGEPRWHITYQGERLDGYWALAAALKRAIEEGIDLTSAQVMAQMDEAQLAHILRGEHSIPLLRERVAHTREIGQTLLTHFDGQATHLIEQGDRDAPQIVEAIVAHFSSFRDEATYKGRVVKIYKRAQIVVADWFGAFGGKSWGAFKHLEALTCFADYKLPQILRRWGVLRYTEMLAQKIDARKELSAGSEEEIEIRAATIVVVERMRAALQARGLHLNSVQVDWALWDAAQGAPPDGKPYHRTRTVFY